MKQFNWAKTGKEFIIAITIFVMTMFISCAILGAMVQIELIDLNLSTLVLRIIATSVMVLLSWKIACNAKHKKMIISLALVLGSMLAMLIVKLCLYPGEGISSGWYLLIPICSGIVGGLLACQNRRRR